MERVCRRVHACNECGLGTPGVNAVPGAGHARSALVLVDVAPGEPEENAGQPFIGRAGKLLEATLRKLGVSRRNAYFTYILKHRPPDNRSPEPHELSTCMTFLKEELAAVGPRVICTLGGYATRAFVSAPTRFYQLRGRFWKAGGYRIFPTFHPAYILRNPEYRILFDSDIRVACNASGLLSQTVRESPMADQEVRSKTGKLLGKIKQLSNGKLEGRLSTGKLLGTYDPRSNTTVDWRGKTLGKGNFLNSLITENSS